MANTQTEEQKNRRTKKETSGFTLIEMLITLAVFTTALTTLANIFLFANRSQRKTQAVQQSQTDARFALEVMAQQVRRGQIDYGHYGGIITANPQPVLALLDRGANRIQFRLNVSAGQGSVQISQDNGASWTDLTPPDISVSTLSFYLSPATDPFAANPSTNDQPLVTIAMSTLNTAVEGATLRPTFLQTTVSSRQYLR